MFKKIFKFIWRLIIFILILLFFFAVIRPAYINYKQNKKEVIVDQSGERATSKNKLKENLISEENNSNGDNENSWKLERKEDYDPFTLAEFNKLTGSDFNYVGMYNPTLTRSSGTLCGAPFVDTQTGGRLFKLRFRQKDYKH